MPSRRAGYTPASRDAVPAPTTDQGEALLRRWCTAIGRPDDADALVDYLEHKNVRSLERFTSGWTEADLRANLDTATVMAQHTARRRGDLIRIRGKRRHDWRTSTAQPMGGAVG